MTSKDAEVTAPKRMGLVAMAAARGHLEAVLALLECGVDPSAGVMEGFCALQLFLDAAPKGTRRGEPRLAVWQVSVGR